MGQFIVQKCVMVARFKHICMLLFCYQVDYIVKIVESIYGSFGQTATRSFSTVFGSVRVIYEQKKSLPKSDN